MAIDTAPKLRRRSVLAFAVETTTGTPVSLTATNGTTNIFNADMKFNTEEVAREQQGNLSPILQGLGARAATCEFDTELVGASGATGATMSQIPLFQACGCQVSGSVIKPLTESMTTLTIGYYIDGRLKLMAGAQGTARMTIRRGQLVRIHWTFTGVQMPTADVALIAPTYQTTPIAPRAGASLMFNGIAQRIADINFDLGNQVILREDAGAVDTAGDPTGYRNAYITGRRPMFTFAPEALPISTQDIYLLQKTNALVPLTLTIGQNAGNMFTLAAPKLQMIPAPQDGDRQGLYVDDLSLLATRNTSLGDDEWTLTIG